MKKNEICIYYGFKFAFALNEVFENSSEVFENSSMVISMTHSYHF